MCYSCHGAQLISTCLWVCESQPVLHYTFSVLSFEGSKALILLSKYLLMCSVSAHFFTLGSVAEEAFVSEENSRGLFN